MNWDAIGAIAELLGAIGVIVTLVYLAAQIRQNSGLLAASVASSSREGADTVTAILATDREAVRIYWAGNENRDDLESADRQQYDAIVTLAFSTFLQAWKISDEEALGTLSYFLSEPGVKQWWSQYASMYPMKFQAFVVSQLGAALPPTGQQVSSSDST